MLCTDTIISKFQRGFPLSLWASGILTMYETEWACEKERKQEERKTRLKRYIGKTIDYSELGQDDILVTVTII